MSTKWRRYEVLLPHNFNDGREVPEEQLAEAAIEVRTQFGAVQYESHTVEGQWRQQGVCYKDVARCGGRTRHFEEPTVDEAVQIPLEKAPGADGTMDGQLPD